MGIQKLAILHIRIFIYGQFLNLFKLQFSDMQAVSNNIVYLITDYT